MRQVLKVTALAAFAALIAVASVQAANTLAVTSPGLNGSNFKLEINIDGTDNSQKWVQDDSPSCEDTYNVEWRMETPDLTAGELDLDDNYTVFLGRVDPATGSTTNKIRCLLRSQPGGAMNPQVRCSVREDSGSGSHLRYIGQSAYNPNFEHVFRFELVKESAPGAGDGHAAFFRDGVEEFSRDDLFTEGECWDLQRLGLGQPVPGTALGRAFETDYDDFVSTR